MKTIEVSIEINGSQVPAGTLGTDASHAVVFRYADSYLARPDAAALSISLPLREEPFSARETRGFFEGLLPEGFTRRSVAQWMHVNEMDYLPILCGLGKECLGAIRIQDSSEPEPGAGYEKLSIEQVRALAAEGASKSTQLVVQAHLSLTGATGKVGLYLEPETGLWYLPTGNAPSTHILKQSHIRFASIVANEQLCLTAASKAGIDVPESFIVNVGSARDEEVLFATKRYDRALDDSCPRLDNLPVPLRLHQEDFAQAMGIDASMKYEPDGERYLARMFRLIREHSAEPVTDVLKLWDRVVFNILIGNSDCHLKNHSLLYSSSLRAVRLAPAYDMLSTSVYESSTRELSAAVGPASTLDQVNREALSEAASEIGLGPRMALARVDRLCGGFEKWIREAAGELAETGFGQAEDLAEQILKTGVYARLH